MSVGLSKAQVDFIGKVIFLSLVVIPFIQMVVPFLLYFKGAKQRLYLNLLTTSSLFLTSMANFLSQFLEKPLSSWVYFFLYLIFVPILTAQTLMVVQHSKKYKQFYLKWSKAS